METTDKSASSIEKSKNLLTHKEVSDFHRDLWAEKDKRYRHIYDNVAQYVNLSFFEENSNYRFLIHVIELYFGTVQADQFKTIVIQRLKESLIEDVKTSDLLIDNFDQQEFICKLQSLVDNIE